MVKLMVILSTDYKEMCHETKKLEAILKIKNREKIPQDD